MGEDLDSVSAGAVAASYVLRLVEFDFEHKTERTAGLDRFGPAAEEGNYLWLDLDVAGDPVGARALLAGLELLEPVLLDDALECSADTRVRRFDDYLFLSLTGCRIVNDTLVAERVSAIVAEHFLLTIHHGPVAFLEGMFRVYRADFVRFAKGPSFLLYELVEQLTENFIVGQRYLAAHVERLQTALIGDIDELVFVRVAEVGNDVLAFRKILVPARSLLTELAQRKSAFVSEETRPFLSNMSSTVECVLADVLADRDILSGSLDLYMSMMGHRTNEVMKRLTGVSVIFLPLTFLCGVYGMNFAVLPELQWTYGYALFWAVVLLITATLVVMLRRARLL
ncbi:MAG: magnesium transporter CorA family protein [Candidatus Binatia bacterium]